MACLAVILLAPLASISSAAQVIHENPADVSPVNPQSIDEYLLKILSDILGSSMKIAVSINNSDYNASQISLKELDKNYDSFKGVLKQLNLTDEEYAAILDNTDLAVLDLRTMVSDSSMFHDNYLAYKESLASGDRENATAYAILLQASYENITLSSQSFKLRAGAIEGLFSNTSVDMGQLDYALSEFDEYVARVNGQYTDVDILLGDTVLTVESDRDEAALGQSIVLTAVLRTKDGSAIQGSAVTFHVNGKRAGTGTTDASGRCSLRYSIPYDIRDGAIDAYAKFIPENVNYASALSDPVSITIIPAQARLSLTADRATAAYGDQIKVHGSMTSISGTPLAGKKIDILVNGDIHGDAVTSGDGTFNYTMPVTASFPGGMVSLKAAYDNSTFPNLLSTSSAGYGVLISSQTTSLTARASGSEFKGGDRVHLTGTLLTDSGQPVSGASVHIYLGDLRIGSARTGADGSYDIGVAVPYSLSPGDSSLRAVFEPGQVACLRSSSSVKMPVTLIMSGPVLNVSAVPAVLFQGDRISVNASMTTSGGVPIPEKTVCLSSGADLVLGEDVSDGRGQYVLSYDITGSESPGLYEFYVSTGEEGLLSGTSVSLGRVLIIPYPIVYVVFALVILLELIAAVLIKVTGYDKRIRELLARSRRVPPVPEEAWTPPVEKAPEPMVEPAQPFDIGREVSGIMSAAFEDYNEHIAQVYMSSRKIAKHYGYDVPDSYTHREFYNLMRGGEPALSQPLRTIINKYEYAWYGGSKMAREDVDLAVSSLVSVHGVLDEKAAAEADGI